jgi:hypothetical protein
MSLNCSHQRVYCSSTGDIYKRGELWWNDIDRGKIEELRENSVPKPLYPSEIPDGQTQV